MDLKKYLTPQFEPMERTEASRASLKALEEMVDESSKEVANARELLNAALKYFNFVNNEYVNELNLMRKVGDMVE